MSEQNQTTLVAQLRGNALQQMTQTLHILLSRDLDDEMPHDKAMQLMRGMLGVINNQQQLIGELIEIIEQR